MSRGLAFFLAFTAFFAVCAGFIFWGTWALSVSPVMPDCAVSYPLNHCEVWLDKWLTTGKFIPSDVIVFLFSPYFWTELQYVVSAFFASLAFVYFLRAHKFPRLISYGASFFLAFCGYWFSLFSAGHLGWFQWMTYGVFAFGLIDRALTKSRARHWLFLGAVLAWGSFYQPDLWLLFTIFSALYFCFRFTQVFISLNKDERKKRLLKITRGVALGLFTFMAIGAISFRHALTEDLAHRQKQIDAGETIDASIKDDKEKQWIFTTNWSLPPDEAFEFFIPRLNGDTSCPFSLAIARANGKDLKPYVGRLGRAFNAESGNYRQHSLYVGFITCLFALLGAIVAIKKRQATPLFFLCAAILFCLISFGRYNENLYRIIFSLPFGNYLRAPVKWHHLTEFSIVVLSAYGLNALMDFLKARTRYAGIIVFSIILLGTIDLVKEQRRFCVPRAADAELTFAGAEILSNPHAREELRKHGIKVIGALPNSNAIALSIAKARAREKIESKSPAKGTMTLAIISLLTTIFVLMFPLKELLSKKKK